MLFFLIGFMGSGKSHWGKLWAAEYKIGFIDMDAEIEIAERKTVSEIFDSKGEEYFRSVEAELLRSYVDLDSSIIACGGGTPCFHKNMKWMNDHGLTIYLSATPEEILRRLMKAQQQNQRPLISKLNQAELLFFIQKKMKEREPFYSQANIILDSFSVTEHTFEEKVLPY